MGIACRGKTRDATGSGWFFVRWFATAILLAVPVLLPGVAAAQTAGGSATDASSPPGTPPVSSPPSGEANLVRDGGFEPPDVERVDSYSTLGPADSAKLGRWKIISGSVDLVGPDSDTAAAGKQFLDLNGNGDQGPGEISQELQTTPGRAYRVRFTLAGNPNGDPQVKKLDVAFGGDTHRLTFDVGRHGNNHLGWTVKQFDVDVCTSSATLTFTSKTEGERGPLIDAVSVRDIGAASSCGGSGAAWWQVVLLSGLGLVWVAAFAALGQAVLRRRTVPPIPPRRIGPAVPQVRPGPALRQRRSGQAVQQGR